ncbi:MAG TPA: hypothetical protein VLW50_28175 [Streptosporangiaceae bacterium]|nr:hypothetical protein [Streptosporangiaceae bacterium]
MPNIPRYPGGGGQVDRPAGEPAPPSIQNAVKLMYAGAAVSVVGLVIGLATSGGLKGEIKKANPKLTAVQVSHGATLILITTVVTGLIGAGLWLWMAWANKRGKAWARILASVFFGISTLNALASFAQPGDLLNKVLTVVVWLIGLGAIILLWRPDASAYYKAPAQPG